MQDQQVASSSQVNQSSDQAQVLQPVHIARDHPLDQIVEEVVCKVDQDWLHFVSTTPLYHDLSQPRLKML